MNTAPSASSNCEIGAAKSCAGCGSQVPQIIFEVPHVPANVGTLARSFDEARSARQGAIRLAACDACGLIQNQLFDVATVGFEPGYEVSLFHSPTFREYIQGVSRRLIERYDLRDKDILEIGCGGGDFLRLICREGSNRGVGIDPTVAAPTHEPVGEGSVQLIPGYFSRDHDRYIGDFVCCLSVFEDIPHPLAFLQTLRQSIGDRDIPLYFEVFNGFRSILDREVWSVHYEQCNYFGLDALTGLFQRAGFQIIDAGTCYQEDQYLYIEARPDRVGTAKACESDFREMMPAVQSFETEYHRRRAYWQQKLEKCRRDERNVVVWGSGGKGISFLSSLSNSGVVNCVVDVNPDRQDRFIPVSGHKIIAPEQLIDVGPDVVILTNSLYQTEITQLLRQMRIESEILLA